MTLPLEQSQIIPTGATTKRATGDILGDVLNVKSFGAVGDDSHDDTANIQACLDAAFGTAASPHGANAFLNKPVFFPAGKYKITAPLLVTQVKSGHIFGAGKQASIISYEGGVYPGNSVANADNSVTPILMTNGLAYATIERLGFGIPDSNTACIYLFGNFSSSPIVINDCFFGALGAPTCGVLAGYLSPNNVSEVTYINCLFNACAQYGLRLVGANTLNHNVIRCGFSSCGNGGHGSNSAAISVASGSTPTILGCDFDPNNLLDFYTSATTPVFMAGCRTESASFLEVSGGGSTIHCTCCHQSNAAGTFLTLDGGGSAIIESCNAQNSVIAAGASNSGLYWRGYNNFASNALASFVGAVLCYDAFGPFTVARLPAASAAWKGIRTFVNDSDITASGNFYTDISTHGGSTNTVPVWCDGAAWRIG